jgi:hypothetical protein
MDAHRLTQIGLVISIFGALVAAWGSLVMVLANRTYGGPSDAQHRREKMAHLAGALLLAVGFAVQLAAVVTR